MSVLLSDLHLIQICDHPSLWSPSLSLLSFHKIAMQPCCLPLVLQTLHFYWYSPSPSAWGLYPPTPILHRLLSSGFRGPKAQECPCEMHIQMEWLDPSASWKPAVPASSFLKRCVKTTRLHEMCRMCLDTTLIMSLSLNPESINPSHYCNLFQFFSLSLPRMHIWLYTFLTLTKNACTALTQEPRTPVLVQSIDMPAPMPKQWRPMATLCPGVKTWKQPKYPPLLGWRIMLWHVISNENVWILDNYYTQHCEKKTIECTQV